MEICYYRYEILQCSHTDKLIWKCMLQEESPIFFVTIEDSYDIIKTVHTATGHGGWYRIIRELGKKFAYVFTGSVAMLKSYCLACQEKTWHKRNKGAVSDRFCPTNSLQRSQADLIKFSSTDDGQYKWIMVYQYHLTKFVVL